MPNLNRSFRPNALLLESRETPAIVSAVGAEPGQPGMVIAYDEFHHELFRVAPYGVGFTGGVRAVVADVNGDGSPDLITAPGNGTTPTVVVIDGTTFLELTRFDTYESTFTGGVNLDAADLNNDGFAEIITGADIGGGPRVRVLDGTTVASGTPEAIADFIAIEDPKFRGGVRIAAGDLNGDGVADLVVGAGKGGGPRVAGLDGVALGEGRKIKIFADFYSFAPGLREGTQLDIRDVTSDGVNDLVFSGSSISRERFINGAHGSFNIPTYDLTNNPEQFPVMEYAIFDIAYPTYENGVLLDQLIPIATAAHFTPVMP